MDIQRIGSRILGFVIIFGLLPTACGQSQEQSQTVEIGNEDLGSLTVKLAVRLRTGEVVAVSDFPAQSTCNGDPVSYQWHHNDEIRVMFEENDSAINEELRAACDEKLGCAYKGHIAISSNGILTLSGLLVGTYGVKATGYWSNGALSSTKSDRLYNVVSPRECCGTEGYYCSGCPGSGDCAVQCSESYKSAFVGPAGGSVEVVCDLMDR